MSETGKIDTGLSTSLTAKLAAVFDSTPNLDKVWIFGSRARGDYRQNSDIDLAIDAENMDPDSFLRLEKRLTNLGLLQTLDVVLWKTVRQSEFREEIERDRQLFWQPRRHSADIEEIGSTQLKKFQTTVLSQLDRYLTELKKHVVHSEAAVNALRAMEGMEDVAREAADFPKKTWKALHDARALPLAFANQPHSSRFDGADRAIPNICLKVPTGGGKTLLAAASVGRVFSSYLNKHSGLVLWVVPNDAIYKQTLKTLSDRDHPYRQMLNLAGAGRVKILEKDSPLTRLDVESHLCVMLLMLQSASRKDEAQKKLKAFRDRGNVLGFTPREDDIEANWNLLQQLPNLDVYAPYGMSDEMARKTKGSIVKSSLGNVLRLVRPMIVMDEGHHAYTENALRTLDGFNPSFLLELSATPRIGSDKGSGSNILVDVRGTDLDEAEMIKLPINVDVRAWQDWQSCLATSMAKVDDLQREADQLHAENNRYIRPILLVQVERTGKEMRDAGFIHAEDAKAYLMQLG
ncbi:MAG: DEAD/DEAH box helicase family protein, partial [Candidatus Methylopumilus sp.]